MRRIILSLIVLSLAVSVGAGNHYAMYYGNLPPGMNMPVVTAPSIPNDTVSLLECGGIGDGLTLNTEAFGKAISLLSNRGGGHLVIPAGVYLSGLISLKDNIDLHLECNAIIVFSPDKKDHLRTDGKRQATSVKPSPAISASKCKNISITGEGIIDGNGEWWRMAKRGKLSTLEWKDLKSRGGKLSEDGELWYAYDLTNFDNIADDEIAQEKLRQNMVRFTDCENVLVSGVTLMNSPKFHLVPQRCNNVIIDGVTIRCPWNAQNGDAIDIGNSRNVLIVNNTIDAGDDGICMKGGAGKTGEEHGPCENINIQYNKVYHAHGGFVIGSEFSGGMKNIFVNENTFSGTDTGLRFKSAMGRGGRTENIRISNIYMTDIRGEAIVFETTYADTAIGASRSFQAKHEDYAPEFQDIHISNVVCRGAKVGVAAHGANGMIHDVEIANSNIFYTDKAQDIDSTSDVKLTNVTFETFKKR